MLVSSYLLTKLHLNKAWSPVSPNTYDDIIRINEYDNIR